MKTKRIGSMVWFGLAVFALASCNEKQVETKKPILKKKDKIAIAQSIDDSIIVAKKVEDTLIISSKHHPNFIVGDFDGDKRSDTVQIIRHTKNGKYGLKIIFGNKKLDYLGLGKEVLGQGFDDINWVGVFKKAPKGEVYFNNVNDQGEIIREDQVKEGDKIKLPNDGIFIHAYEACGGGVIYWSKGKFKWIQQE